MELASLYRHWIRADAIKYVMHPDLGSKEFVDGLPDELKQFGQIVSSMFRLEVFYSLIQVVVEGYQEMGYTHEQVDELLSNEDNVRALRRFRNAVFHFQKEPIDKRLVEFMNAEGSSDWIRALHSALEQFFLANLPIREMVDELSGDGT